jgi:hypothetical protein
MRDVELTPEVKTALAAQIEEALGARGVPELATERDTLLLDMMETLAKTRRARGFE